jgi:hypothetical protein
MQIKTMLNIMLYIFALCCCMTFSRYQAPGVAIMNRFGSTRSQLSREVAPKTLREISITGQARLVRCACG